MCTAECSAVVSAERARRIVAVDPRKHGGPSLSRAPAIT